MKGTVEFATDASLKNGMWWCAMVIACSHFFETKRWRVSAKNSHEAESRAFQRAINHACWLIKRGQAKLVKILHDFTLSRKQRQELSKNRWFRKGMLAVEQIKGKDNPADPVSRGRAPMSK